MYRCLELWQFFISKKEFPKQVSATKKIYLWLNIEENEAGKGVADGQRGKQGQAEGFLSAGRLGWLLQMSIL